MRDSFCNLATVSDFVDFVLKQNKVGVAVLQKEDKGVEVLLRLPRKGKCSKLVSAD